MKLLLATLLFLCAICPGLTGQNYQAVNSGRTAYFTNGNGEIQPIRIDSVIGQQDSILYPFHNIQPTRPSCYTPFGDSWIGEKVIIKDNGENLFFNLNHDTIRIETKAEVNDSWMAFDIQDSIKVRATVTEHDTAHFLGITDSVKTISFQAFDRFMDSTGHRLNGMSIRISKNHGLVTTLNFHFFPDWDYDFYYLIEHDATPPSEKFQLIGLSNPQVGIQNLTWREVHDYQPGDEIHVKDWSRSDGNWSTPPVTITTNIEYKCLERTDHQDSTIYLMDRGKEKTVEHAWTIYSYELLHDTVKWVYKNKTEFNTLPKKPVISNGNAYPYEMKHDPPLLSKSGPVYEIYQINDSCWALHTEPPGTCTHTYYKGLGGPYFNCRIPAFPPNTPTSYEVSLEYFKKGNQTWGTPLNVSVNEHQNANNNTVYPNPANDKLWIEVEQFEPPYTFELTDISGKAVIKKQITNGKTQVNVSELKSGFYLYNIADKAGRSSTGKLIIK